jgi:hypothetical protein
MIEQCILLRDPQRVIEPGAHVADGFVNEPRTLCAEITGGEKKRLRAKRPW